jgi:transcriptional regulator with XRE-family HTH domain
MSRKKLKKSELNLKKIGGRIACIRLEYDLNQAQFADIIGISKGNLSGLENHQYNPSYQAIGQILENFNVDPDWFLLGKGDTYTKRSNFKRPEIIIQPTIQIVPATPLLGEPDASHFDQYIAIPLVEGRIAAGPGKSVSEDIESFVWVYRPEVGKRMNLVAVKLGDNERSMIPVLSPGAIVILDLDDKHLERRAIYGVRTEDGGCAVKRIHITSDTVLLLSENPEYGPEKAHTSDPEALIIGRVIWSWQSFVK